MMCFLGTASAESPNEAKYYCPLNAAYLLQQLSAMEALPLYPSPEQFAPLKEHSIRMAAEELKINLLPLQSCNSFKIGIWLEGLEKGLAEFPKQFASYKIAELLTESEKRGK